MVSTSKEGSNEMGELALFRMTDDETVSLSYSYGSRWRKEGGDLNEGATGTGSIKDSLPTALPDGGTEDVTATHTFTGLEANYHTVPWGYLEEKPMGYAFTRFLVYNWFEECWTHLSVPNVQHNRKYVIYSDNPITDWPSSSLQSTLHIDGESAQGSNQINPDTFVEVQENGRPNKLDKQQYVYEILDPSNNASSNENVRTHPSHIAYWSSWANSKGYKFGNLAKKVEGKKLITRVVPLNDFAEPLMHTDADGDAYAQARWNGVQDHLTPLSIGTEESMEGIPGTEKPEEPDSFYLSIGTLLVSNNKYVLPTSEEPPYPEHHKFSDIASRHNDESLHVQTGEIEIDEFTTPLSGEDRKKLALQAVWVASDYGFAAADADTSSPPNSRYVYEIATHLSEEELKGIGKTNPIKWKGIDNDPNSATYGEATTEDPE
jgi:hypothetical protein